MLKTLQYVLLGLVLITPTMVTAQNCVEYKSEYADGAYGDSLFLYEGSKRWDVDVIVQYNTIIGDHDFYNSKGLALTNVLAVLQQDRANVNRFGKPNRADITYDDDNPMIFVDEKDDYFTTPERRALFADMTLEVECFYYPDHMQDFTDRFMGRETFFLMIHVFEHPKGGLGIFIGEAG